MKVVRISRARAVFAGCTAMAGGIVIAAGLLGVPCGPVLS